MNIYLVIGGKHKEMIKLLKFRVLNFRSVNDSGWIETNGVTALIGTNEAGKTNLLTPLWKLKPAEGGEINAIADYPRKRYNEIRAMEAKPMFIEAHFELDTALVRQIATITGATDEDVSIASISRDFGGQYQIGFPNAVAHSEIPSDEIYGLLLTARNEINDMGVGKTEEALKISILSTLDNAINLVEESLTSVHVTLLKRVKALFDNVDTENALKRSTVAPRFGQVVDSVEEMVVRTSKALPSEIASAGKLVLDNLPSFVYYSNYGNLDSEIYLPHVIENMKRDDLGSREEAKARTLKVLFEFVKLQPQEIWELGRDAPTVITKTINQYNVTTEQQSDEPTEEEIRDVAGKKKEREILLTSASASLTDKFRDWWRQGEYRFRFNADGNHFRIWVSDDKRPEEIELEGRSTGLQWFLSFYLTFLVESADGHKDSILLLDEPGQSLHPLAQQDLSKFFDNLSETNQLLYTAHSPFLVDSDHLDRVKAVYIDATGATVVSANLRANQDNKAQTRSIYPVNAAIGLTVSDTMLEGCQPVIVEGPSDQIYLSSIKNYLLRNGHLTPRRELVFVPAGGSKGVTAVVPILAAKTEALPYILLDSDAQGQGAAKSLKTGVYQGQHERVVMVGDICKMDGAEVEDLIPYKLFSGVIDKFLRGQQDQDFSEMVEEGKPVVPQVEAYAKLHGFNLILGWKVDVSRRIKARLLADIDPIKDDDKVLAIWKDLFNSVQGRCCINQMA